MSTDQIIKKYIKDAKTIVHGNMIMFEVTTDKILSVCRELYDRQLPLKIISAFDERKEKDLFKVAYIFGLPKQNMFLVPYIMVKDEFPSLTPLIHQASNYERKIYTFFGLKPTGHPSLRTLILHENWPANIFPLRKDFKWNSRPKLANGDFQFRKLEGEGVYEIPVGPVHAGIIEPGHFRFSVLGEEILLLEPRLGYSHKGSEKLFEELPLQDKIKLSERISGDSSFSHSLAFCLALESLGGIKISSRTNYLRVIFAELERLSNHIGDIGAIMVDTGYNFGGASGARLKEVVMQINEELTGSRFLRGVSKVGGINATLTTESIEKLIKSLNQLENDFKEVIHIAENTTTLLLRLKKTGVLQAEVARDHGVIGVAGKAIGFEMDARVDYPYAAYNQLQLKIATEKGGDVYARFEVRIKEVYSSIELIKQSLRKLSQSNNDDTKAITFKKNSYAIGIAEGWRGDIIYLISTDSNGEISRVDVRDPSFLNWAALGFAGKGNMVPDFPLINKSFNLSYSGNDL